MKICFQARSQTLRRTLSQTGSIAVPSPSELASQQHKKVPTVVPGVTVTVLPTCQSAATTYRPPTHHLCGLDHGSSSHSSPRPISKKPSTISCCRPKAPNHGVSDPHLTRHKLKAQDETATSKNSSTPKAKLSGIVQGPNMLPPCLDAKDEVETYATEGSPNIFSTRSSLSDLTMNSSDGPAFNLQRLVSRHTTKNQHII